MGNEFKAERAVKSKGKHGKFCLTKLQSLKSLKKPIGEVFAYRVRNVDLVL
jgi:hypothetical protein